MSYPPTPTTPIPTPAPIQPKPKWYKTRWFIGVACGLIGIGIGSSAKGGTPNASATASPVPTTTVTTTATATATTTVTAQPPEPEKPKGPSTTITDGKHEVGVDIVPGTYAATGGDCYWARLKNASGELGDIIANGLGPGIVTIAKTDKYFESRMCTWTRR